MNCKKPKYCYMRLINIKYIPNVWHEPYQYQCSIHLPFHDVRLLISFNTRDWVLGYWLWLHLDIDVCQLLTTIIMVKEIAQCHNCKTSTVGLSQNIHYITLPKNCVCDYTWHWCIITWIRLISSNAHAIHIHAFGAHKHNWPLSKGFHSQIIHQFELTKLPQQKWGSK